MTSVPGKRQGRPIEKAVGLVRFFVAGDEGHGADVLAMRQWDAGEGARPQCGGHARHHLVRESSPPQRLGLLAAATEQERIAALQTHHAQTLAGAIDHYLINLRPALRMRAVQGIDANPPGRLGDMIQKADGDQSVVKDQVGPRQQFHGTHRQQAGIARSRPDQGHRIRRFNGG